MSVYHVKGSDPLLRDRVLDALVDELLGGDDRSFALEEFVVPTPTRGRGDGDAADTGNAGEAAGAEPVTSGAEPATGGPDASTGGAEARNAVVGAILNAATSPPFMTQTRVVVVRDAGALNAADVEPIVAYLDDPLPTTVLVLVAGGGSFAPALAKKLTAVGAVVRAPKSEKTGDVLVDVAHEHGVLLTAAAAKAISAHLADDAGRVEALVDVLETVSEPGTKLDADDVAPYLGEEGAIPPYQLTNAIETGDSVAALEVLHRLLTVTSAQQPRPTHPLQLMGTLLAYYRRVLRLDDPGIRNTADAIEVLGGRIKEYPARKALNAARALGTAGIREAFDVLARADLDLKGARGMPADAVMEVLVVRLARLSARSGVGQRGGGPSGTSGSGSRSGARRRS